jgi:DNA-binding transcriptional MerR regulator|tara:strand:+ start:1428 stop:2165 length:738 start_codon:yes stop_codon:yes gene_type:complete
MLPEEQAMQMPMQGNMMQPQMPMDEVSQMEVQEAQEGLMQILQVIETLVQQGLSEDEILALLAQYGITEAELEQAAQVLGVDIEQLLGGAQMEQPQMEAPQQPMMMANGGALSSQDTGIINSALNTIKEEVEKNARFKDISANMPMYDQYQLQQFVEKQNATDRPFIARPFYEDILEARTSDEQIFSLNARINNLMTSYDMLVRNKEFDRAQEVADQIDEVQQQIIAIQSQNVPQMGMGLGQKKN